MVRHVGPRNDHCEDRVSRAAVKAISCLATGNPTITGDAVSSSRKSSECQPNPEYLDRIKGDFSIEATFDVGSLAKAVLLAREKEITDGISIAPQRLDHNLGLVRRHHRIVGTLEKDNRLRQPIGVVERRPLAIARLHFRKGPDEPIEIPRLELMSIARQC